MNLDSPVVINHCEESIHNFTQEGIFADLLEAELTGS